MITTNQSHTIFECPHALQTWALVLTPSCLAIFPTMSMYTNLDYLFRRKNKIKDLQLDNDLYPCIIWYLWKACNDKLFWGITWDLLELIRHTESECQADETQTVHQIMNIQILSLVFQKKKKIQILSLQTICLVGSWTAETQYSGYDWVWMDGSGNEKFLRMRTKKNYVISALRIRDVNLGNGHHASIH